MTQDLILQKFRSSNALLEGHFLLSSGLHSSHYLQCALALQQPVDAAVLGNEIAGRFKDETIDAVASPAIGGLIIGFSVAQAMNIRYIWTERQEGEMQVRRGFSIRPGERFLVVEDVITTGGSTRDCIAAIEALGGEVVAAASIIDRSNGTADVGIPRVSLVTLDVPVYSPWDCPMCAEGDIPEKPGSRK